MRGLDGKVAGEGAGASGQRAPRVLAGSRGEEPRHLNSPAGEQNTPNSETLRLSGRHVHNLNALNRSLFRIEVNVGDPNVHHQKLMGVAANLTEIRGVSQPYEGRA